MQRKLQCLNERPNAHLSWALPRGRELMIAGGAADNPLRPREQPRRRLVQLEEATA